MSYRPYFQLSDLQAAPWSLILHHSYSHSYCFAKFPARSAHSQVLKGKGTLAFGWLCATMSSAVSSFLLQAQLLRNSSEEHTPSRWREISPVLSSCTQSSRKCRFRITLLTLILSWPHQKENSSQGPHPCFIVWGRKGAQASFEKKSKTQASHMLVKKKVKSTTDSPSKFVVSSLGI